MKILLLILGLISGTGFLVLWYAGFWIGDKFYQMPGVSRYRPVDKTYGSQP